MVAALLFACLDDVALMAELFLGPTQRDGQHRQVGAAECCEYDVLEIGPDALIDTLGA